jgi:aminopeptidase 2
LDDAIFTCDEHGISEQAKEISLNKAAETVSVTFANALKPGTDVVLSLDFEGIHNDKMAGFYRSGYKDAQGNKK